MNLSALSRDLRDLLLECPTEGYFAAADLSWSRPAPTGAALSRLAERGLLERSSDPSTWGRSRYTFTALGLRTRETLARPPADISIPLAAIAPMPEPSRIAAIARIATRGAGHAWGAAEVAARHGYLYGWYAALECAVGLDVETLKAAAQAIEARRAATAKTGAVEDESAVPKGCAP